MCDDSQKYTLDFDVSGPSEMRDGDRSAAVGQSRAARLSLYFTFDEADVLRDHMTAHADNTDRVEIASHPPTRSPIVATIANGNELQDGASA